jgi:hypothetical protein
LFDLSVLSVFFLVFFVSSRLGLEIAGLQALSTEELVERGRLAAQRGVLQQ